MALVTSGKDLNGNDYTFHLDDNLLANIKNVKEVVTTKDFDFVSIVAGLPGAGKSNFAMNLARYFCPWFDHTYIAFTADEFIHLTSTCPKNSSVVLDESFETLNSKVGMSADFVKVINHLQLIRQRNLFIILNLPNFFDLSKSIAIYRSSFLFVCYGQKFGSRGSFAAYGRDEKKVLYIKGAKFMNYNAAIPNFRGKFVKQRCVDESIYDQKKLEHLKLRRDDGATSSTASKAQKQRNLLMGYIRFVLKSPVKTIKSITGMPENTIYDGTNSVKEEILSKWVENKGNQE